MSQSYVSLWPNTSNKEWVNILPPCASTTGVPSLHLIACFHKVYRNLLLQSLCAFWGTPLQLTSRFRVSREWDTNQAHECTTLLRESHFLIQGKAPDTARGEPHTQGGVLAHWTQDSVTRVTWAGCALLSRVCSVYGKAPDLPTSVQFLYKASQGSARQYNIFVDISVPQREALLWLCVSHLWLCQKIVHSLFSQAKPPACAKAPSKQTGGGSWRKETRDHCTQSHLLLFSHIYWTQPGSNPSVQETC